MICPPLTVKPARRAARVRPISIGGFPETLFAALFFALFCIGDLRAEEVALVQESRPVAEIVLASKASRAAGFAAKELQHHIKEITGAELPIVNEETAQSGVRILVGESRETVALGFRNSDFKKQEYAIHFKPGRVILMGRDKEDFRPFNYDAPTTFPDLFDEQGSCYAVYDFLERFCGVRWYLPTALGTVLPKSSSLTVEGDNVRRAPVVKSRRQSIVYQIPGDLCGDTLITKSTPPLAWRDQLLWYHRHRLGGEAHPSTHSLYGYYDRFWAKNPKNEAVFENSRPDWFAQGYPEEVRPPQLCYSNAGLVRQVVQDARDYFDGKGKKSGAVAEGDYFVVTVMDGGGRWCKCAQCRAVLKPEAVRGKGLYSNDLASNYIFGFINKVAREVEKTHPGKFISTLAYNEYAYPAEKEEVPSNLDVTFCFHTRNNYSPAIQANDDAVLESWVKAAPSISKNVWLYYCFPAVSGIHQKYRCFPGFFAHTVSKKIPYYVANGISGVYYEPSMLAESRRSVLLDQLEFYLTWKLSDDPSLDGDALIDEFFKQYYGPAAEPMRKFYEAVEQIYKDPANYPPNPGHQTEAIAWGGLGTADRMKELAGWIDEAKAAAGKSPEKERIALFEKGVWQYMQKGKDAYDARKEAELASQRVTQVPSVAGSRSVKGWPDLDWSKGAAMTRWYTPKGETAPRRIEGRLLHDGDHLYLQLREQCDVASLIRRDGEIWDEDFWEILLSDRREAPVLTIGVNADGLSRVASPNGGDVPGAGAVKAVSTSSAAGGWEVCVAVPLKNISGKPNRAELPMYLNVLRASESRNAAVWVPVPVGALNPIQFGELRLAP